LISKEGVKSQRKKGGDRGEFWKKRGEGSSQQEEKGRMFVEERRKKGRRSQKQPIKNRKGER